jgi:hypothetical protein
LANYVRTGPFTNNVTPPGVSAAFLNALENVLEQPSGGTETGKYYILQAGYINAAQTSMYVVSISRTAVPVSVVIDEADVAHTNVAAAVATLQTANGFLVSTQSTGVTTNERVAGNYTLTY